MDLCCSSEDVDAFLRTDSLPVEPQLLGECVGHSGAVQVRHSDSRTDWNLTNIVDHWKQLELEKGSLYFFFL